LTDNQKQQRAAAEFKKAQRDEKPMTAYETEALAIRAKTERLKALRLARDANAPAKPAPASRAKSPAKPKGKTKKEASGTLAQWLEDRQKDGHG